MSQKRIIPKETLIELYINQELTIAEIGKKLHSSCHTVRRNLKDCNIHIQSNAEIHTKHGYSNSRQYRIWLGMKTRCNNPNQPIYKNYGAKGISYPDKWEIFEEFWADMKENYTDNKTLDRIDSSEDYSKDNCRWINYRGQNRNKSDNVLITYKDETKTIAEWSEEIDIPQSTLYSRKQAGWPDKKIIGDKSLGCNQFSKK